jgi:hypothetical protein
MRAEDITIGAVVDVPKEQVAGKGGGLFSSLYVEAINGIKLHNLASKLNQFVKEGHKSTAGRHYQNRTHKLVNATGAVIKDGDIYIGTNERQTVNKGYNYTPFILYVSTNENNSWGGDNYIAETITYNEGLIIKDYQKALDESVEAVNNTQTFFSVIATARGIIKKVKGIFSRLNKMFGG